MQRFELLPTGLGEIVQDIDRSGMDHIPQFHERFIWLKVGGQNLLPNLLRTGDDGW